MSGGRGFIFNEAGLVRGALMVSLVPTQASFFHSLDLTQLLRPIAGQ